MNARNAVLFLFLFVFFTMGLAGSAYGESASGSLVLRVLTYNIHGLPFPKGDHSRYADIGRALRKMRQEGTAPHIVAIQEAFHDRTRELIEHAGYPHVRYGAPAKGSRSSAGLVVLSEFPITESSNIVYSTCTSWDCFARKGALHARISVPGFPQPLEFYNTHMNSDPDTDFWTDIEEARRARLDQVQEVREFMWATKISQAPSIFPGDFNFLPDQYEYLSFVSFSNMNDALERCLNRYSCSSFEGLPDFWRNSVDYQFYMSGTSPTVALQPLKIEKLFTEPVNGRMLSDHPGLLLHYQVSY